MLRLIKKFRLPLLALIAFSIFAWLKPELIPIPQLQSHLNYLKADPDKLHESLTLEKAQVLGITDKISNLKITLPEVLQNQSLPEEIVVEDLTQGITDRFSQLPQDQAKKVKKEFCQDLINQAVATLSAENQ